MWLSPELLFELFIIIIRPSAPRASFGWIVRAKDQSIAFLLAGTRNRIPMRAYKLCRIPDVFAFAGGISFRGRTVMPSAYFLRG